jgi:hypothetical protein
VALYAAESSTTGPVAGFPKYVANPNPQGFTDPLRPTAAVGDLDNDGQVDVVQVANGQVYLWHTGKPVTPATKFWPMFQRDLHSSGRLKQGLGASNLLAVDYLQGRLYDVDGLTAAVTNPRPTSTSALGIARDASGATWMMTENSSSGGALLQLVDPATGAANTVAQLSVPLSEGDLAVDPATGTLYLLVSSGGIYTVASQSGALTPVGTVPGVVDANGLAFDGQGNLYVLDGVTGVLFRVDPTTGAVLGQLPLGGADAPLPNHKVGSLAWDGAAAKLYTTVDAAPTAALYQVDPLTGFVTSVGPLAPADHVSGLTTTCQ